MVQHKKKLTKWQRKVRAHNAAARRRKVKAIENLYRKLNPGSKKKPMLVRVKKLKGGGVSVTPVKNPGKGRFARCVAGVEKKGGAYDPRAVCAASGRAKYGQAEMTRRARAGKKRAARKRTRR